LENFVGLTAHLGRGSPGGGVGKFLNLVYVLPLRSGLGIKPLTHMLSGGIITNRAAKIITSEEGMKLYENYIRAVSQQTPRAIKLAVDELSAFNERNDKEWELEREETLRKFKEQNPDFVPQEAPK